MMANGGHLSVTTPRCQVDRMQVLATDVRMSASPLGCIWHGQTSRSIPPQQRMKRLKHLPFGASRAAGPLAGPDVLTAVATPASNACTSSARAVANWHTTMQRHPPLAAQVLSTD